jgi:hypothetical protein
MAERVITGIPEAENKGIMSQVLSPFLPFQYSVKKEPTVATGEVDGSLYYRQTPGQYEYQGLGTPSAVTGGIDFFKTLLADPKGTVGGVASAVKEEVEAFPERQLRTGMAGGEEYNPETGMIEKYDPFAVPLLQGVGTLSSVARASASGDQGTILGMMGGDYFASKVPEARESRNLAQWLYESVSEPGYDLDRALDIFEETKKKTGYGTAPATYIRSDGSTYTTYYTEFDGVRSDIDFGKGSSDPIIQDMYDFFGDQPLEGKNLITYMDNNLGDLPSQEGFGKFFDTNLLDHMPKDHPIVNNYGEILQDYTLRISEDIPQGAGGHFDESNKRIAIRADQIDPTDPNRFKSVMVHELQHLIQKVEGLPQGGASFRLSTGNLIRTMQDEEKAIDTFTNNLNTAGGSGAYNFGNLIQAAPLSTMGKIRDYLDVARAEVMEEMGFNPKNLSQRNTFFPGTGQEGVPQNTYDLVARDEIIERAKKKVREPYNNMIDKMQRVEKTLGLSSTDTYQNYLNIAGEKVARSTEDRERSFDIVREAEEVLPQIRNRKELVEEILSSNDVTYPVNIPGSGQYGSREELELLPDILEEQLEQASANADSITATGPIQVFGTDNQFLMEDVRAEIPPHLIEYDGFGGLSAMVKKNADLNTPELLTSWVIAPEKVNRSEVADRLLKTPGALSRTNSALDSKGYGDTVPMFRLVKLVDGKVFEDEGLISATLDPSKVSSNINFLTQGKFSMSNSTDYRLVRYDVPREKIAGYLPALSEDITTNVNAAVKNKGYGQEKISGYEDVDDPASYAKSLIDLQDEVIADVAGLKPTILSGDTGSPINMLSSGASIPKLIASGEITKPSDMPESYTVLGLAERQELASQGLDYPAIEAAENAARQKMIESYQTFFGIKNMKEGGAVSPNFISRVMDPKSPMTQDNAMVQLMDFSVDGRFFVAPTVFPVDSPVGPVLTKLSPDMAIRKAFNTGEFLEFDTEDQAREFAMSFTDVINVEDRPKQNLKKGIAKYIPYMK